MLNQTVSLADTFLSYRHSVHCSRNKMLLLVEITSLLNPKNERVKKTATYFDSHRFFGIYYNIMFERSKLYSLN